MANHVRNVSGGRFATLSRKAGIAVICLFSMALPLIATPALAASRCTITTPPNAQQMQEIFDDVYEHTEQDFTEDINEHVTQEFIDHRTWMLDVFWIEHVLPAMMSMTEQLSATALQQFSIIGTFFDAKHQLETQRLFQEMASQAQKDYNPSEAVCTIGTTIRSLGATERNVDLTTLALSAHSLRRQLLNANMNSSEGPKEDLEGRIERYRRIYCEGSDNNRNLFNVCAQNVPPLRKNKDVDFVRTLGNPDTLDVRFAENGGDPTNDEEDLMALASNLYAHDVFEQMPEASFDPNHYLAQRSVIAQRSVAEQSYHALAAMKSKGANDAQPAIYMQAVLEEVGIPNEEAVQILGEDPSYYAQMGILTKTMFQRPEFFVGLYERPANVARKSVALHAVSLMQKRDIFKSNLRSEAILSILLELEVEDAQRAVQNNTNRLTEALN